MLQNKPKISVANSKSTSSAQPSMLSTLLFGRPQSVERKSGRIIRFDDSTPDICYTTGPMRERVLRFLRDCQSCSTSSEIARGIASNASRTTKTLADLVKEGLVESIKLEGCIREYQCLGGVDKQN